MKSVVVGCILGTLGLACAPLDESPHEPAVAALVGQHLITEADLDAAWRQRKPAEYTRAQQDIYRMRRAVLEDLVTELLVADEVALRNRSEPELVTLAVENGTVAPDSPVDESEVVALYDQSGAAEYGIGLEELRPDLVEAIEEQRVTETRARYLDNLRATRDVQILLDVPRTLVPVTSSDPARGVPDAPIQIVEFSDFHCPFCARTRLVLERVLEKYSGQVQWIWKDYPLDSTAAAMAAACAHEQGRFWAYHDALFDRQQEITLGGDVALLALAGELALHERRFATCVAQGRQQDGIASDVAAGRAAGVRGTPTVFVNGRMIAGAQPFGAFERIVLEELALSDGEKK